MTEINLVPRSQVSFEEFSQLAQDCGWIIDQESIQAARYEESPEYLWRVDDLGTVKLIQSATLGRGYVVIVGDEPELLARPIRDAFPAFTLAEIIERLAGAREPDDQVAAFRLLAAAGLPSYDATVYQAVRAGLAGSDPLVRIAALTAAFYLSWRQFEPLVEQLRDSPGASENIRATAGNLLGLTHWDRG